MQQQPYKQNEQNKHNELKAVNNCFLVNSISVHDLIIYQRKPQTEHGPIFRHHILTECCEKLPPIVEWKSTLLYMFSVSGLRQEVSKATINVHILIPLYAQTPI